MVRVDVDKTVSEDENPTARLTIPDGENPVEEITCGFGSFRPRWLQKFASKKAFMAVYVLLSIIQGSSWAYFTATITTLEKRFKISSQTAGIVMTGNEISQILFSIIISYYGGQGHRPRWISLGVMFSALSCILLASPHFFYGPGSDALSLTEEYSYLYSSANHTGSSSAASKQGYELCDSNKGMNGAPSDCEPGDLSVVPLILIFLSQFVSGIGVLLFFSLGGPYLDDNLEKTKSPLMFGITMCFRLVGPTMGFLFAAACLKTFISPTLTPIITPKDPRWLGAWWLGWVVLGTLMFLTSFLIAMFPRTLPRAYIRRMEKSMKMRGEEVETRASLAMASSGVVTESTHENHLPKISELPAAVKALLTNKINLFNSLSGVFYLFASIGYWTYMPKYLETIFMQTAVNASVVSGTISIAFQSIGLLVSGALISKYQPSARFLAGWNVFIGLLYTGVKFSFTFFGCNPGTLQFGSTGHLDSMNLTATCNLDCGCKMNKIFPICNVEKDELYYSPCHAGCTNPADSSIFQDCRCLSGGEATMGTCSSGCFTTFVAFLGINAAIKLLDSSGRIGNMLVSYRCVDPKDKSLTIGLGIFLVSILAFLPSPILFGKIIDSTCLVWGTKCGSRGNCWLYNGEILRYRFNLFAAIFTFIGAIFDILVWYHVKDLDLYDEEKNIERRKQIKMEKFTEKNRR